MGKIGFIQVTVEPWHFDDRVSELRIKVNCGRGEETQYMKPLLNDDDLFSLFDIVFEQAKASLLKKLKALSTSPQGKEKEKP